MKAVEAGMILPALVYIRKVTTTATVAHPPRPGDPEFLSRAPRTAVRAGVPARGQ